MDGYSSVLGSNLLRTTMKLIRRSLKTRRTQPASMATKMTRIARAITLMK